MMPVIMIPMMAVRNPFSGFSSWFFLSRPVYQRHVMIEAIRASHMVSSVWGATLHKTAVTIKALRVVTSRFGKACRIYMRT